MLKGRDLVSVKTPKDIRINIIREDGSIEMMGILSNGVDGRRLLQRAGLACFTWLSVSVILSGCGKHLKPDTIEQYRLFEQMDFHDVPADKPLRSSFPLTPQPYIAVSGDVLELNMPSILRQVNAETTSPTAETQPFICRICPEGFIHLPIVGDVNVAGLSAEQIETLIKHSYYPRYIRTYPSVYVKVIEQKTYRVSITGAIKTPGIYNLTYDQMSLSALIMEAGGILETGASSIRIDPSPPYTGILTLPVTQYNIPSKDVYLRGGDRVTIEPMHNQYMTVLGLVRTPGNYEYPPEDRYNLMQAIGFAGGLDVELNPKYAILYRHKKNGQINYFIFSLTHPEGQNGYPSAIQAMVCPGDIIDIAHTPQTRTQAFLNRIFHITVGGFIPLFD